MSEHHNTYLLRKPWYERVIESAVGKQKLYLKTDEMTKALDHLESIGKRAGFQISSADNVITGYFIKDLFKVENFTADELKEIGRANAAKQVVKQESTKKWHSDITLVDTLLIVASILNAAALVFAVTLE